ncbi:sigma D regulator [Saccharophagus degradans]|uniref:Regulator of RNA polymerase sigma(70) subunit, Rsd/AlgQ n=2 Tax=Saccharophagus degradans TaxID=86304 RepID=Q21EN8_SACD2|nr:sigma D regulator [Saccharophagus degradans]ABD82841.1 regulator of RNA polymerase sigma(70) subunit, Rsd/AlgQ [Saccharophagus degradans 2-40]MBU2986121.1 sigma D regulator [Saccharophagus degradans]MDO6423606.1 sigma D regulator [Saccharophagus degradans]MDO6607722.1 sigma D regulator [Saccharophagus degradans]WGO98972.1 sigma D regulator [Saccharophagus degradans]
MLEDCKSAQERWGGVSEIIDRWLQERQQMLVLYCNLSEICDLPDHPERAAQVKTLCEIVVDYVSAGHFEIYNQLLQEGEEFEDQEGLKQAGELFKIIDSSTEVALDFNDKYLETDDLETINQDLSHLGESLVSRFEAEDKMIEVLHVSHKDQVA